MISRPWNDMKTLERQGSNRMLWEKQNNIGNNRTTTKFQNDFKFKVEQGDCHDRMT